MVELTYGELKTALICCTVYKSCNGCPLYLGPEDGPQEDCTYKLMSAAMNCINVMEKDLTDIATQAKQWEEQCLMREKELFALRESLDIRRPKE